MTYCLLPWTLNFFWGSSEGKLTAFEKGSKYVNTSARGCKTFSCSTQLSMEVFLLINVEMPTVVGISTFKRRKNSIPGLSEPEECSTS